MGVQDLSPVGSPGGRKPARAEEGQAPAYALGHAARAALHSGARGTAARTTRTRTSGPSQERLTSKPHYPARPIWPGRLRLGSPDASSSPTTSPSMTSPYGDGRP